VFAHERGELGRPGEGEHAHRCGELGAVLLHAAPHGEGDDDGVVAVGGVGGDYAVNSVGAAVDDVCAADVGAIEGCGGEGSPGQAGAVQGECLLALQLGAVER